MSLQTDWKNAKNLFKNATDAKKPAQKFLGVRQGTGIDEACKKVDGAKTVGDMKGAIATLKQKGAAYVSQLNAVINDPASVKATDKAAYTQAVAKLKTALVNLESKAEGMLEVLEGEGGGKKDKVDPKYIENKAFAESCIKVLKEAEKDATGLIAKLNTNLKGVADMRASVVKQAKAAQEAAKSSNTMMHTTAVGVIDRFVDEADKISEQSSKLYAMVATDNDGALMKARESTNISGLPPAENKKYRDEAMVIFKRVSKTAVDAGTALNKVRTAVEELRTFREMADALGNQMQDPSKIVAKLNEWKSGAEKLSGDLDSKVSPMRKSLSRTAEMLKKDAPSMRKHAEPLRDKVANYRPLIDTAEGRFNAIGMRLRPTAEKYRENKEIMAAAKGLLETLRAGLKLVAEGRQVLNDLARDLDTIEDKASELESQPV